MNLRVAGRRKPGPGATQTSRSRLSRLSSRSSRSTRSAGRMWLLRAFVLSNNCNSQMDSGRWCVAARGVRLRQPWRQRLCWRSQRRMGRSKRGLASLVRTEPRESFWMWRLKFRWQDKHVQFEPRKFGWSWVPGTVSWVVPTSLALIVLACAQRRNLIRGREVKNRLRRGYDMLFDRMCPGGGWNAGNSVVYRVPLSPHIDATAIALIALRPKSDSPEVRQSLSWLLGAEPVSAFSLAWKILALESYRDIEQEIPSSIATARTRLADLARCPTQLADTATLALTILALRGGFRE